MICELHCEALWQAHRSSLVSETYWLSNEDVKLVAMCAGCCVCVCLPTNDGSYEVHEVVRAGSGPMAFIALEAPTGRGHFRRLINAETFDNAYNAYCLSILGDPATYGVIPDVQDSEEVAHDWSLLRQSVDAAKFQNLSLGRVDTSCEDKLRASLIYSWTSSWDNSLMACVQRDDHRSFD